MKASGKCNYDYVVLQATDNSIAFYESMGFVRVGAVVKDESVRSSRQDSSTSSSDEESRPSGASAEEAPGKPVAATGVGEIISSETTTYTSKKQGETPSEIAKKLNVDVYDIIFLNKDVYKEICPSSRLLAGTLLHIPVQRSKDAELCPKKPVDVSVPQWYTARENETPRTISKKLDLDCAALVDANKGRLTGLMSNSRLKDGTRIKISHLDILEGEYKPYAHWSFPDDQYEEQEPSYMMALKLNRRRGHAAKHKPVEESLAIPITQYQTPNLLLAASPQKFRSPVAPIPATKRRAQQIDHPDAPVRPKRPMGAFMVFSTEQREIRKQEMRGMTLACSSKLIADLWRDLPDEQRAKYEVKASAARQRYFVAKEKYEKELKAFLASQPIQVEEQESTSLSNSTSRHHAHHSLYNKVVKLKEGAMTEGSEYTYW